VNIALDDYLNLIRGMRVVLVQIQRSIKTHQGPDKGTLDIQWDEVGRLQKVTDELEAELESVSKLLSEETSLRNKLANPHRTKRGLVNLFGYGLEYLFGTADARDVRRLNDVCDTLHTLQKNLVHAAEQQLTYLRTLDEATKANARTTLELAKTVRDSIQNFSLGLGRVEADLIDVRFAIEKQARYSIAI
jgi:hypothetical protein